MKRDLLRLVLAARSSGRPAALATNLRDGRQALLRSVADQSGPDAVWRPEWMGALALDEAQRRTVQAALAQDRHATFDTAEGPVFVEVFNPPLRCFIVGAVHIAQPLARMAALAGYAVTVIDPRSAFATDTRFPGVELSTDWPDEAFERLKPDRRSAVITLTHDPKIDDPALSAALRSEAFYIGALGSKRTHRARRERLSEAGFGEAELDRIHGPVGLDIGAVSPAEIAVAILAQVTEVLRGGPRRG
jgi:xanthine dehydrogenase accessory factor